MKKCILGAIVFAILAILAQVLGQTLRGEDLTVQISDILILAGYGYSIGYIAENYGEYSKNNKK